jgi:hypothetical protein
MILGCVNLTQPLMNMCVMEDFEGSCEENKNGTNTLWCINLPQTYKKCVSFWGLITHLTAITYTSVLLELINESLYVRSEARPCLC